FKRDLDRLPATDLVLGQQLRLGRIVGGTVLLEETIALAHVLVVGGRFRGVCRRWFLRLPQGWLVATDQDQRDQERHNRRRNGALRTNPNGRATPLFG